MTDWQLATHRSTGQRYWCREMWKRGTIAVNQWVTPKDYEIRTPYHVKGDTYDLGAPLAPERSPHSGMMPVDTFERLYEIEERK